MMQNYYPIVSTLDTAYFNLQFYHKSINFPQKRKQTQLLAQSVGLFRKRALPLHLIIKDDYQIYYLKCNIVGISNLKSCPSLRGTRTFSKEKVRRGFLTYRIAINRTTRGKPLHLQKTSFFDWPRKARHSFGELKFPSSQTLLITQCPL